MKGKKNSILERQPEATQYTAIVRRRDHAEGPYYEAKLKEFGDQITIEASSPEEALTRLYEEAEDALKFLKEKGKDLPQRQEEEPWESYSGKFTVRIPISLHYTLHQMAREENISLNSLAVSILSAGCVWRQAIRPMHVTHGHYGPMGTSIEVGSYGAHNMGRCVKYNLQPASERARVAAG